MDESTRIEVVTPALATKWLEANTNNRPVSDPLVERYAEDMRRGRWRLTGQGITFGKEGVLLDGQHRLWAVITSNADVRMTVLRGAQAEALACVDIGRARSVSDVMRLVDGTENAPRIRAMMQAIEHLTVGSRKSLSYYGVRDAMEAYRPGLEWSLTVTTKRTGVDAPLVFGALAFAYPTNPEGIAGFAARLRSGAALPDRDPALTLRNYLLLHKSNHAADRRPNMLKVLRAAMGHIKGEKMAQAQAVETGYMYFAQHYAAPKIAVAPKLRKVGK